MAEPLTGRCLCGAIRYQCGSPLTYRNAQRPGEIDVTIGSLDRPDMAAPADYIWMQDAPSWDHPADGLPQHSAGRG
jgi:hypothetical protein